MEDTTAEKKSQTAAVSESNPSESEEKRSSQGQADKKAGFCYCGKDRNLNLVELLCASCTRWFHESCISYQLGRLVPFITNYVFVCKNCSQSGLESFRKSQATILQLCITAIANLQQTSVREGKPRTQFTKEKDIIPYIEQYWEAMTTMPRRVTQSWHTTVQRTLVKDVNITFVYEEQTDSYGLVNGDLRLLKPNYDNVIKSGILRLTEDGYTTQGRGELINSISWK